jgi:hypothetical protein
MQTHIQEYIKQILQTIINIRNHVIKYLKIYFCFEINLWNGWKGGESCWNSMRQLSFDNGEMREGLHYFSLYFLLKVYFFIFLFFSLFCFSFYLCFLIIIMVRVFGGREEFRVFLYGDSLSLSLRGREEFRVFFYGDSLSLSLLSSLIYSPLHRNILIFYPLF